MIGMQGHGQGDAAWHREQLGLVVDPEILRLQREVANRNARALEGDKAVAVNQKLVDEIEKLTKQRDELLAACEGLIRAHRITASTRPPSTVMEAEKQLDEIRNAVAVAEAAIASVKEEP